MQVQLQNTNLTRNCHKTAALVLKPMCLDSHSSQLLHLYRSMQTNNHTAKTRESGRSRTNPQHNLNLTVDILMRKNSDWLHTPFGELHAQLDIQPA